MTINPESQIQAGEEDESEIESRRAKHEEYKLRRRELAATEEQEAADREYSRVLAKRAKKADRLTKHDKEREAAKQAKAKADGGSTGTRFAKKLGRIFKS